jgi:hypothetical protein
MEILEPGIKIITYIEQNYYDNDEKDIAEQILQYWLSNIIYMGTKTMRGYGAMQTEKVLMREFVLTEASSLNEWLKFDMYADSWNEAVAIKAEEKETFYKDELKIKLQLKQVGGIFIRRYTTQVSEEKNKALPDYEQLTVHIGDKKKPTIPGTSWAGAFRHRMISLNEECNREDLWGCANPENKKKSSIRFSETILDKAKAKQISRNSIDRFSGGAAYAALFTEKTYYGGETELIISINNKVETSIKKTLAAAITDLHYGFLAVGGLTAVGRGLFEIQKVNGLPISDNVYEDVLNALGVSDVEV